MTQPSPFRYFKTSPEIIRLVVMLYIHFPLCLRNVEDLLHERGSEGSHATIPFWLMLRSGWPRRIIDRFFVGLSS